MKRETSKQASIGSRSNREAGHAVGIVVGFVAGMVLFTAAVAPAQPVAPASMAMKRVEAGAKLGDPEADFWRSIEAVRVPVMAQAIATPTLARSAISDLEVRAAHDGTTYAFRIEWEDKTKSDRIVVDNFGDQVAIELPMQFRPGALPSPMMGNPGARVSILQWRAAFQHDLEYGHPKLRDVYPNAMVDVYPDQVLTAVDAKPYTGALGVDNPVSTANASPVLDQMAEGYGTMTVKPEQHADGKGSWAGGRWSVVITHPLSTGHPNDPDVKPGAETAVAFAVWEGGDNEVGGRKGWAPWVSVQVAK